MFAEQGCAGEAGFMGDVVDGKVAGLEQASGVVDAALDDPLVGAHADLGAESTGEGPKAHRGMGCEVFQCERLPEVAECPFASRSRRRGRLAWQRLLDELGLAAVAPGSDDAAASGRVSDLGAVVAANQVRAQVDSCGAARGGEHAPCVDEQHVRLESDLRDSRAKSSPSTQWLVAGSPSSSPAAASTKAEVHMLTRRASSRTRARAAATSGMISPLSRIRASGS